MSLSFIKAKQQTSVPATDSSPAALPPPPTKLPVAFTVTAAAKSEANAASMQPETTQTLPSLHAGIYDVETAKIPGEMKKLKQWFHWIEEPKKDKLTKIPYIAGGSTYASSTNPATWTSFEEAVALRTIHRGLGIAITESNGISFTDLDEVRNPQTGEITPWAERLIQTINSYTEFSPSDEGLHIYSLREGPPPGDGLNTKLIELYFTGRYATVTGKHYPPTPLELKKADLAWLHRCIKAGVFKFDDNPKYAGLFNNVFKGWKALGYPSHSEADMALCRILALKLANNFDDIDAAFRLSGLMRKKWDEKRGDSTYGRDTILKVLNEPKTNKNKAPTTNDAVHEEPSPQGITVSCDDNDLGNAERLIARHRRDLRFLSSSNKWLVWDGQRYAIDDAGAIEQKAIDTVKATFEDALVEKPHKNGRPSLPWARASMSAGRISASVRLAKSDPRISIKADQLDADPWLFNCMNGTIDLRTGKLQEHRREDLITQLAPVVFDPNAKCPVWDKFLLRIRDNNAESISFLQRVTGYSLTGSTKEGKMFLQYGSGRNGKTVYSETINYMAGDYARTADASLLLTRKSDGPRHDIARLRRTRLVWTSETAEGGRFDEAQVKLLTGGDKLSVRNLYEPLIEFYFTGKMWLRTNKKPEIHGRDVAIWSRILLIPFLVTIPDNEQDKDLLQKLLAELPGILAWAIRGCLEWQQIGLCPPPEVLAATKEYEQESDPLKEFLEDCCIEEKALTTLCVDLYMAYQGYCEANGHKAKDIWDRPNFGKQLTERGFGTGKKGKRYRTGIGLKPGAAPGLHKTLWTTTGPTVSTATPPNIDDLASKL